VKKKELGKQKQDKKNSGFSDQGLKVP